MTQLSERVRAYLPAVLAGGAIAAQITYPLAQDDARDVMTIVVVLLSAAACLVHAAVNRGAAWTAGLLITTAGIGLASEVVGTATGIPYGCYSYATDRLGPDIAGVPFVVPLAWTAGFYPVWCVSVYITRRHWKRAVLTVVGVVGWDLYLDAQMVADGQWRWCVTDSGLPGLEHIPLTNYAGWLLVAVLMVTVMSAIDSRLRVSDCPPRVSDSRRDTVPLVLFAWTWLGSALAHSVFLSAPELRFSAVYGLLVMGVLGMPLARKLLAERAPRR
ncbi:carotenoid biosynthesis protein [Rhodococcus sp. NPDC058521]|uniref:carotenoid biosynthesis protein n=1 Tax=Rhodococcus sp. NPDC058521 TaxID=3346536 RepID=UPI0036583FCC